MAGTWAGFQSLGFCEQDLFCQAVIRKNFGQDSQIFGDVRTLTAQSLWERGINWPFLVSAGFPCQQISIAGNKEGLGTEAAPTDRSGLWFACLRFIRDCQPRYVLLENVRNLVNQGIDVVLGGLEQAGYTCWAGVMGAEAVGAPHRRERVFIVGFNASCDGAEWGSMGNPDGVMVCREGANKPAVLAETQSDASGARRSTVCNPTPHTVPTTELADTDECRRRTHEPDLPTRQQHAVRGSLSAVAGVAHLGNACGCRCSGGTRGRAGTEPADGHSYDVGKAVAVAEILGHERKRGRVSPERAGAGASPVGAGFQPAPSDSRAGEPLADTNGAGRVQQQRPVSGPAEHASAFRGGVFRWPTGPGQPQHEWEAPRTVPGTQSCLDFATDGVSRGLVRRAGRLRRLALKAAGNAVAPQQCWPVLVAIREHHERVGGIARSVTPA